MANKQAKKVYIDSFLLESIKIYADINHMTFSSAVNDLCNKGLVVDQNKKFEYEISKDMKDCKWNIVYIKSILKQIYSDLNLPFNDIKQSKNLKRFEDSYRGKKLDD